MAGLDPKKEDLNWKFIQTMGDLMSPNNFDGLGYTAADAEGKIFGERWLFNEEAFRNRKEKFTKPRKIDKEKTKKIREMYGDIVELEDEADLTPIEKYGTFGDVTPNISAITLHTRAASGIVCYPNIHPFVDEKQSISVIHNGFIRNHTKLDEIRSTCDSERILNMYIEHEINKTPADMQNFIDDLKGWFACGVLSLDQENRRVLDVFRTGASLSAAYVKELNTVVFSTAYEDIKKACRKLGLTIQSKAERTKEDTLIRLDALTGEKILSSKYMDTTNRSEAWSSDNWGRDHMGHNYNPTDWEKKAKERRDEEAAKAALKKQTALTVVTEATIQDNIDDKLSEKDTQELAEMKRSGVLTAAEVLQEEKNRKIKSIMDRQWSKEAATEYVENLYKQKAVDDKEQKAGDAKEKAINNIIDRLQENEAAQAGWYKVKESGVWIKKPMKQ